MREQIRSLVMFFIVLTMTVLVIASIHDIRKKEISFWMLSACGSIAVLTSAVGIMDGVKTWEECFLAIVPGVLLLLIAYVSRQGIGYGDGFLVLAVGPVFGFEQIFTGVCLAFGISAVFSIGMIVFAKAGRKSSFPFIPFLTSAMGVILLAAK
jgi:leader peptidase (prepilin peptidase)/N-methyltransferase